RLCKSLRIDPNKKIIVFAPRLWKQSPESKVALNEIVNSLRGIKDAALIIKVHHVDDNSFYHEFLSGSGYNAVVTKETDLYTLLYCSDLVISISSTVMLDALIMGKPVIQLNLLENYDFFEGLEGKVFEKVTDKKDLPEAVKRVLYNKKLFKKTEKQRKKFISEYYYKVDGKSTERFIGVMDGLLNRKE
ncbi:CDP-glycerol glycerophosphotransferase family protein, partial [Candidatus Woesearchaeota archaeon]|nr:CDP-glycerol glycerophosphotransferase family protein [Candidatus Woesearchaeota archaeon]